MPTATDLHPYAAPGHYRVEAGPLGIWHAETGGGLRRLFPDAGAALLPPLRERDGGRLERQLAEYLDGRRLAFDVPLNPAGTPFRQAVWQALGRIAYGTTASYGEIARLVGRPGAARAVGAACRCNPLLILIPCHRVVASDGRLTGFAAGLAMKKNLLNVEKRTISRKKRTRCKHFQYQNTRFVKITAEKLDFLNRPCKKSFIFFYLCETELAILYSWICGEDGN